VVANIRNDKSTAGECVDHVSRLFVNFYFENGPRIPGESNPVGVSGEFPNPPEFGLEFTRDWRIVTRLSTRNASETTHTRLSNLPKEL
jgi:hypothetical protein